ncbi:epoxide hydrolase [bacterium]|nr:MAG: epoxide hydrolase [bacterium]
MYVDPYTIAVPDSVLADLHARLEAARLPDAVLDAGWEYGSSLDYMRELVAYWKGAYDWRARERYLNSFPHELATIDGYDIHFVHARGKGPSPLPLIMTHGWPSSFTEMLAIIPLLTDPASAGGDPRDAFDVIVPSVPGYGFSSRPTARGFVPAHTLWAKLMTEHLGYTRFVAEGGDIGAGITTRIARLHPDVVHGICLLAVTDPYLGPGSAPLTSAERAYQDGVAEWDRTEGGYQLEQATKPQTLAYGLNDSPVGLAAWIVEKFRSWSDCGGDVERRFTRDELLDNVMIYWTTQTIASSVRYYYEGARHAPPMREGERVEKPTAALLFPADLVSPPPREWIERSYNLQQYTLMPKGGHFAAHEEPALLAEAIRGFCRRFRS